MEDFLRLAGMKFVRMDKTNEYDRELLEYAIDLGLTKPKELSELCRIVETLARYNPSLALTISAHHLALYCLNDCEGICAFALTEKSGSNVKDVKTKAERLDDSYRIKGFKTFITNGEFANHFVVSARYGNEIRLFRIDGNVRSERINLSAFRGSGISKLYMDNVGKDIGDLKLAMISLNFGRIVFSSLALGMAKRCFELALNRAKRKGLIENVGIRWRFAELKSDIEALAGYLNYVVSNFNAKDYLKPAVCKLKACRLAKDCADFLVEIFGAKGLVMHSTPETFYRYAKSLDIGEGTTEIMKEIISRTL